MPRPLEAVRADERRLPDWLRKSLAPGTEAARTDALMKELGLHTICESGRCPNRDECYSQRTATFLIMGDICTRSCSFCSVSIGRPGALEADEGQRVASAARRLGLAHVVITSVNRDDLADEGAEHFASVVRAVRAVSEELVIEVLTPDFKRTQPEAVARIVAERPDVFNHNIETVPSLYRRVRPQAHYDKSLSIFSEVRRRSPGTLTKSGLMLGLGEREEEVLTVLSDLRRAGCEMLTLGQYLRSSSTGLEVSEYVTPAKFGEYKTRALEMGFEWVESSPFVRSSYHAKDSFEALKRALRERRSAGEVRA
ncbi:MAG: Lipoyl synthase 2 [Candidatus Omnitrophica bacterium]|nr:Lipoyl synthase 2 [Candidatus Omnitrophota bacterium]